MGLGTNEAVVIMSAVRQALKELNLFIPIRGYEGLYEINRFGDVRSIERMKACGKDRVKKQAVPERILKQTPLKTGYLRVFLAKDGKTKTFYIHRLVAEAFIPNKNKLLVEVNHLDRNRQNNSADNLNWMTHKDNLKHTLKNGGSNRNNMNKHNTSGHCGISFDKRYNKWIARITVGDITKAGKRKYIGSFETKEEAVRALFDRKTEETVIKYAVNYMVGRGSYGVGCVCDHVKSKKNDLSDSNKQVIERDILERIKEYPNMPYKQDWLDLIEFIK